ncbi:helix-turn-helix domain-containing protein [Isachenkonia alkalipeptolytica]|nr:helix-turn-helix domain-containing protein [Isachenkonia alkalipeptolytica]
MKNINIPNGKDDFMEIGEKIRSLRKEKNLSQEGLAEKLKVSRQSVSKWEAGQSIPEVQKILLICDLFGLTADEFLRQELTIQEGHRGKNTEHNAFIQRMKRYQRELLIAFAFILTVSFILNVEGRSTIREYQRQTEWVRDQLYVSYFEELDQYHDHLVRGNEQEIMTASTELLASSRRMREMGNHHLMLDIEGEGKAISSIVYGTAVSIEWIGQTLENSERITPNKIKRIEEIPDLLGKILRLEKDLQQEIDSHGYDIEDTETYEKMHSLMIELAMLTFAHGFEADQILL